MSLRTCSAPKCLLTLSRTTSGRCVATAGESVDDLSARLHTSMEALLDEAIDTYPEQPRNDADRWWLPSTKGGGAPDVETAARLDREALARIGDSIDD